jgi:hypothetical protein
MANQRVMTVVENLILGIAAGRITRDEAERILSQRVVIAN